MKIILADQLVEAVDGEAIKELRRLGELKVCSASTESVLSNEVIDAEALVTRTAKVTKRVIESGRQLKVIGKTGTGVDNIDLAAATAKGVYVVNVPVLNSESVAEHTFAFIFALSKNLFEFDKQLRSGNADIRDKLLPYNHVISRKTIGIIGLGAVGVQVARMAKALNMKVLAFDPYVSVENFEKSIDQVELKTLLENSDYVTIHVPLNEHTQHLISERELNLMKKSAFLINCARGGVVDEEALAKALESRKIFGAGVDVFEKEFDASNVLFKSQYTIVTPHIAGQTSEARVEIMNSLVGDIKLALEGHVPRNLVNKDVLTVIRHI